MYAKANQTKKKFYARSHAKKCSHQTGTQQQITQLRLAILDNCNFRYELHRTKHAAESTKSESISQVRSITLTTPWIAARRPRRPAPPAQTSRFPALQITLPSHPVNPTKHNLRTWPHRGSNQRELEARGRGREGSHRRSGCAGSGGAGREAGRGNQR